MGVRVSKKHNNAFAPDFDISVDSLSNYRSVSAPSLKKQNSQVTKLSGLESRTSDLEPISLKDPSTPLKPSLDNDDHSSELSVLSNFSAKSRSVDKTDYRQSAARISILKDILDTMPTSKNRRRSRKSTRWSVHRTSMASQQLVSGMDKLTLIEEDESMGRRNSPSRSTVKSENRNSRPRNSHEITVAILNTETDTERRVSIASSAKRISITFTMPGNMSLDVETELSDGESSHSSGSYPGDDIPTREGSAVYYKESSQPYRFQRDFSSDLMRGNLSTDTTSSLSKYISVDMISNFESEKGPIFE